MTTKDYDHHDNGDDDDGYEDDTDTSDGDR